ncbi:DUF6457 domain-containing protein [Jatrophihabitans sp. YIM 134969]
MPDADLPEADLLVVAGGPATRLGGLDKALLRRPDGRTVLEGLLAAPVAGHRVVVGPERAVAGVDVWTREDPPGGGPVAALAAGLPHVSAAAVVLLAGDLPAGGGAVPALLAALGDHDAAVVEAGGRRQWLLAVWRTAALRGSLHRVGDPAGARVRALYDGVDVVGVADSGGWSDDLDTPADVERLTAAGHSAEVTSTPEPAPMTTWLEEAAAALDLPAGVVPVTLLLDLARDAAHGVARPAAPLTTFLAGLAAGRAGGSPDDVRAAVDRLSALLADRG